MLVSKSAELLFQNDIIASLQSQGWLLGISANYDRKRALYPEDALTYVQETQPDAWEKFCSIYPKDTKTHFFNAIEKHLNNYGTLWTLRHTVKDRGTRFELCTFKPDHELNPDLMTRYKANRLRIVPELVYSPNGYDGRIDLTLFVNGLPVATLELKSAFKQTLDAAKLQYINDRQPKTSNKPEPLLTFKRGALVHFAVSQYEVAMTTKLDGKKTFFLPFNRGTTDGSAGNDQPVDGYATSYLWQEILQPDNWLRILHRYLHLESKRVDDPLGHQQIKETLIFPRYHQWSAVQSVLATVQAEGIGKKYLIQHSAGSGKSNSIAWLSHQLATLYRPDGHKIFNSVIVITDRTVLDNQLQDTIYQFEHTSGVISRINHEESGSKSSQLAEALSQGTPIIIVTIQTFPHVLKAIQETTGLKGQAFAIIADEAHSSQTGSTARQLREVLMAEKIDKEEIDSQDMINATLEARRGSSDISYFAFTATPKAKTLELFGRPPHPDMPLANDNKPKPFHLYSMRQAIEEGFILDVLKNYTSYGQAYKLALETEDKEVDSKKTKTKLNKWVRLHPHNIAQKAQVVIEHFRENVAKLLNHEAKAMVVTSSRLEAVKYKQAFNHYVTEKGYKRLTAMVAFSGEVVDEGESYTENSMNPGLKGRDMRKAFDTDDYQVMLVANKFQTGFDQPKLVAMYVDKKLKGVDCIQTLSRLNRTYPGKDTTYVLDFVNDPQDVLAEFKEYYQNAELITVSDPNLVYAIYHKLNEQHIWQWNEVTNFSDAYFDPKRGPEALTTYCKPAVDRFTKRYRSAIDVLRDALSTLEQAKQSGDKTWQVNCERSLNQAREAKDVLDTFKKDMNSFTRFYEFASQIVDLHDEDLERLNVFVRHLLPLLREERLDDDLDISQIQLTHYRLWEKRTQDLKLQAGGEGLKGITSVGSSISQRPKDLLSHILEQMNDLFGADTTEGDKLTWLYGTATKVSENESVMAQLLNNSVDQIMHGDFPNAVESAVIESMGAFEKNSHAYLSDPKVSQQINLLIFEVLMRGLRRE
ncbi:type I restriction endonuclease subunit R [Photorhabdus heterorhabditis]|uniref:type I restriction endonuclease subunit R n=1 Tax=Photorhabdus heterorhabditis TaxID=880156 RepID=UPI0009FA3D51|nr:DEAD/DEAH box helicase family protein [Photorhabdus heterorhabditis]